MQPSTIRRVLLLALHPLLPFATATAQRASPAYPALELSPADLRADLDLLRRALEHLHPGLTRYATREQLDAAFASLAEACARPMSDVELYRAVSIACATIRCGHTRVMAPRIDTFRETNATQLPFTFRIFGDELVVDAVAASAAQLQRGDRVVRIEDRGVAELVEEIGATVCLDGATDSVRASRLDTAYEFVDSGFDHYLPAWLGFRSEFRLDVVRGEEETAIRVPAVDRKTWRSLAPRPRDFADATSWRTLDPKTAVLAVDTFVNYRKPIDATKRYRELFREIRAAEVEHLIVDLRRNGGGSTDASWPLARFLVDEDIVVSKPPIVRNYRCPDGLREHLSTWEQGVWDRPKSLFKKVDGGYELSPFVAGPITVTPHPDRFRGRIIVLTSRYNASGSTMLVACLQEKAGIRLVGESTGGAPRGPTAGILFTLELPKSRLRVNIPALRERTTVEGCPDGVGVTPDVEVEVTVEDFLAGRDPVLAAARRYSNRTRSGRTLPCPWRRPDSTSGAAPRRAHRRKRRRQRAFPESRIGSAQEYGGRGLSDESPPLAIGEFHGRNIERVYAAGLFVTLSDDDDDGVTSFAPCRGQRIECFATMRALPGNHHTDADVLSGRRQSIQNSRRLLV